MLLSSSLAQWWAAWGSTPRCAPLPARTCLVRRAHAARRAQYVANHFDESLVTPAALDMLVATGAMIFCLALLGCTAACKNGQGCWRAVLLCYSVFVFVAVVVQVAACIIILVWVGKLSAAKNAQASEGMARVERDIELAVNRTYMKCCHLQPNATVCEWLDKIVTNHCASYADFRAGLIDFLTDRLRPLGAGAIALAVVQVRCAVSCGRALQSLTRACVRACACSCFASSPPAACCARVRRRMARGPTPSTAARTARPVALGTPSGALSLPCDSSTVQQGVGGACRVIFVRARVLLVRAHCCGAVVGVAGHGQCALQSMGCTERTSAS